MTYARAMTRSPIDLATTASALTLDETGIWVARGSGGAQNLSFPADGHASCFGVEDDSFWFAHRNRVIAAALVHCGAADPFLDIGAGNGAVSSYLASRGVDVVTLEPARAGALNARKRGLRNVICCPLEDANFAKATFGAAGLFDVIEHLENDTAMLAAVRPLLRPQGIVAVTVPASPALWSREDVSAGHYRRYTRGSLARALESSGFEVVYSTCFFAPLVLPLWALRSLPYYLAHGRPLDTQQTADQHRARPVVRRIVDALLAPEVRIAGRGGNLPVGTSCLAIARCRA